MKSFPHFTQLDAMDCGPTCLRMVAKYYGKSYSLQNLRDRSYITKTGVNLRGLSQAAESIGFRTTGVKITFDQLCNDVNLPCIVHWNANHFVVCHAIRKSRKHGTTVSIADPGSSLLTLSEAEFRKSWENSIRDGEGVGVALLLQPGPDFNDLEDEDTHGARSLSFFLKYLSPYRKQLVQIVIGMIVVSILQLIFPFLTQSLVDVGVRDGNIGFIQLVLLAQAIIFIARLSVEYIRSWILLHMNTRINIALISDFLIKLMKMPLRFFDTKNVGDILQRIGDHRRIESFLTGNSISTLFSFINFFVFALVLGYYNLSILLIFLLGNTLYVLWVLFFMKYRRSLDFKRFEQSAKEQSNVIQMINGMQDIKLNNCERQKRWSWERIQVKLFKISIKSLAIGQFQQVGSVFFNQTTNLLVTFMAAQGVVHGTISLGMMLSITYIIGQLNAPVDQFIGFAQSFQEAKLSLERLNEIHGQEDEEQTLSSKLNELPDDKSLMVNNLSFSYDGSDPRFVLDELNLLLPESKVTAIVGASGSGKTTLVKLLLGFYDPSRGTIKVGNTPLNTLNPHLWRNKTGSVLQDGFLFSDSIANNIAIGEDEPNKDQLRYAATVANIREFIDALPMGYNTKIGMEGMGLSQGQKQRILIARAVYKNPEYLFFDEATNALDANNEKIILEQLHRFYKGKTVVVVAHRLSTVRDADQIVVLDQGKIAEVGNHQTLTEKRGIYYDLVKNQLELGS
ncbi:MAG TPA: peptidase domain-containing ABC transporter [Bacteroidales bacterium]|nr:peptidase domain-containing ABC transporter [Bacteroidales bacterium]